MTYVVRFFTHVMGNSKDQNLRFFAGAHILLAIKDMYDSHDHTIILKPSYYLLPCSVNQVTSPSTGRGAILLGLTSLRAALHRR